MRIHYTPSFRPPQVTSCTPNYPITRINHDPNRLDHIPIDFDPRLIVTAESSTLFAVRGDDSSDRDVGDGPTLRVPLHRLKNAAWQGIVATSSGYRTDWSTLLD